MKVAAPMTFVRRLQTELMTDFAWWTYDGMFAMTFQNNGVQTHNDFTL